MCTSLLSRPILKDKVVSTLSSAKAMLSKNTLPLSEGEVASSSSSLPDKNHSKDKTKGKILDSMRGQNRRNILTTEDKKKTSSQRRSSLISVEARKAPKLFLSKNLIIAAIDVTENPFALRIPRKHHPICPGSQPTLKLLK